MANVQKIKEDGRIYDADVYKYGISALPFSTPGSERYKMEVLIAGMLSPRARDPTVGKAFDNIKILINDNFSPQNFLDADKNELLKACAPAGMAKQKTDFIVRTSAVLLEKHNGSVPTSDAELRQLPGVGPKIAALVSALTSGVAEHVAVDTHVHRISNRLEWVSTKNEIETQKILDDLIPPTSYLDVNKTLVAFGQTICSAKKPRCDECTLQATCGYFRDAKPPPAKKTKTSDK